MNAPCSVLRELIVAATVATTAGCALQYYDEATGTQHLYGIGHLRMKVSQEAGGPTAVVTGTRSCGIGAGTAAGGGYALVGYQDLRTIEVLAEDSEVRLEWPTQDFFSVRVGKDFPHPTSITAVPVSGEDGATRAGQNR